MKAVILAGGRGTRLKALTGSIPKPMIKIGGIPVLEHQINLLKIYGIRKIIICTGYLSDKIENYFGEGKSWGVEIIYSKENTPLGSAGCIKEIEEIAGENFLVLYGDVMINMNLNYLTDFHNEKKACATLVVHPNDHPYDSDLIEIDDNSKILEFFPKPHPEGNIYRNLVNAGVYVLKDTVFTYIQRGKKCDFGKDIFPLMLEKNEPLYAYNTPEYIKDMGTLKRLSEVQNDIETSKFTSFNLSFSRPAVFLDRDGVINEEKGLICSIEDVALINDSAAAVKELNNSRYFTVVITNQPVVAKGLCSISELKEIHKKIEILLGREGAKIDRIYFCPHHPEKGFSGENVEYKIDCDCRKPKTGMIERAKKELNIDVGRSFLIGDMTADIMTAKNAEITSVGVRSGYGCRDGKYNVLPDIWADNLSNAVNIIFDMERYEKFNSIILDRINEQKKEKLEKASASDNLPFIVSVGGIARSGKSVFAFFLKRYLKEKGYSVLIIDMDNWIVPAGMRTESQGVIERFRLNKFEKDLVNILNGKTVKLKKYNSFSREYDLSGSNKFYNLCSQDAVIIIGACALCSGAVSRLSNFKIFVEVSEDTYRERFYKFYRWKKLDEENIDKLYNQRLADELPVILDSKRMANLSVKGEA
ncbi:MAG: HAD-IIIA family hydrolase [Actinobacteria bacterium]|nr:HAD-IIIA family hydrolase [Actinomycetota bacterium]